LSAIVPAIITEQCDTDKERNVYTFLKKLGTSQSVFQTPLHRHMDLYMLQSCEIYGFHSSLGINELQTWLFYTHSC